MISIYCFYNIIYYDCIQYYETYFFPHLYIIIGSLFNIMIYNIIFDIINNNNVNIQKHSRLLQITAPTLEPFHVKIVHDINKLGVTERGTGGFGSTGN